MNEILFVYITTSSEENARSLAQHLLEKNLIACANIFASHKSLYWWENKIESATETAFLVKTTPLLYKQVQAEVKNLHPYTVPCITAFSTQAYEPYFQFVTQSLKK